MPKPQKPALTINLLKSALSKSTDAPMVVVKILDVFPASPLYSSVQAMGIADFSHNNSESAVMPLLECPYTSTVAPSGRFLTVYTSEVTQISFTPLRIG